MAEVVHPVPEILPIYPLRDQVVFPHMLVPLFVAPGDMPLVEEALRGEHLLGVVYRQPDDGDGEGTLAGLGTLCRVNRVFRLHEGGGKVMVEGQQRIRVDAITRRSPFLLARCTVIEEQPVTGLVSEALVQSVSALLKIALAYGRPLPGDVLKMIDRVEHPGRMADLVAVYLDPDPVELQRILEILDAVERLKTVYLLLTAEVQKLQVRGEIQSEVAKRLGRTQKEYLLKEQMRQIQEELGDEDPRQAELRELRDQLAAKPVPEHVRRVAERELGRLERIHPASPEYTVARSYLESLCSVPWLTGSEDRLDLAVAEQVLDEDHYGLAEVKERILEFLAVRSLRPSGRGPILCFVGPPGVGKTSLGRSIARAMERRFIRISLGGMKDEAEIRGHRRTYIGAMPGRILQEICRAEVNNPVFMLDEVDKIGQDFRGDPASALLEVLDPEQNDTFTDHYLDLPFDLSRVMFITTANILDPVPHALRDRMEVIRLSGYSDEEKEQIAIRYLIPKQLESSGLEGQGLEFRREAVARIIRDYTREAGVRELERRIAAICRKRARRLAQTGQLGPAIASDTVAELLGPSTCFNEVAAGEDRVGVATGLAWTETGGDIIFVEAGRMAGEGRLELTGSLGGVMQESARTALSFVRAHAAAYGIPADFYRTSDLHIHVPAGAVPKDGPSAGLAIALALLSLLTGRPARREVAVTGELTLAGRILPVGGIKDKLLAARRAGVRTVLLPARNRDQLRDLDPALVRALRVELVDDLQRAAALTLLDERLTGSRCREPAAENLAWGSRP